MLSGSSRWWGPGKEVGHGQDRQIVDGRVTSGSFRAGAFAANLREVGTDRSAPTPTTVSGFTPGTIHLEGKYLRQQLSFLAWILRTWRPSKCDCCLMSIMPNRRKALSHYPSLLQIDHSDTLPLFIKWIATRFVVILGVEKSTPPLGWPNFASHGFCITLLLEAKSVGMGQFP